MTHREVEIQQQQPDAEGKPSAAAVFFLFFFLGLFGVAVCVCTSLSDHCEGGTRRRRGKQMEESDVEVRGNRCSALLG